MSPTVRRRGRRVRGCRAWSVGDRNPCRGPTRGGGAARAAPPPYRSGSSAVRSRDALLSAVPRAVDPIRPVPEARDTQVPSRALSCRHQPAVDVRHFDLGERVAGTGGSGRPTPPPLLEDDPARHEQVAAPDPVLLTAFDRGVQTSDPDGTGQTDPLRLQISSRSSEKNREVSTEAQLALCSQDASVSRGRICSVGHGVLLSVVHRWVAGWWVLTGLVGWFHLGRGPWDGSCRAGVTVSAGRGAGKNETSRRDGHPTALSSSAAVALSGLLRRNSPSGYLGDRETGLQRPAWWRCHWRWPTRSPAGRDAGACASPGATWRRIGESSRCSSNCSASCPVPDEESSALGVHHAPTTRVK